MNKKFLKNLVENKIPIHQFLGLELLEVEKGFAKVRVPFKNEVVGDIRNNRWHGGIIATIMDSVGGIVGSTFGTSLKDKMATIDLRIDYLSSAKAKPIVVEGEIVRLGNQIMVTRMKAYLENEKEIIAEGKGIYHFIRLKKEG